MSTRQKILILSAVVLVAVGFGVYKYSSNGKSDKTQYKEHVVKKGEIELTILSTGEVKPENKVEIKPPIAGRADQILVKEGDMVKKNQVLAWMSSTERAALIDAATAKGAAEKKEWEEMYKATPILAPINGMIIQRNIESGQTFATTDAVLVMSDRLTVKAQVDETDIAKIKLKQKAELILDAYPSEKISAKVDEIAFDAKTVNNVTTYLIDVLPDKAPAFMRSGMTANVTFYIENRTDTLVVPTSALQVKDGVTSVLVKSSDENKTKSEVEVKLGISDGKRTEILSGLEEGAVILVPEFRLEKKSSANSPFGGPQMNSRRK